MYACPERGPIPDENMQTAAIPMKTCVAPAHMERPRTCWRSLAWTYQPGISIAAKPQHTSADQLWGLSGVALHSTFVDRRKCKHKHKQKSKHPFSNRNTSF